MNTKYLKSDNTKFGQGNGMGLKHRKLMTDCGALVCTNLIHQLEYSRFIKFLLCS